MDVQRLRQRAKQLAREQLTRRGIEVRRVDAGVRRSLPAVLGYYAGRGLQPATVVDVGVGPGTPDIYAAFPDARLVLVEPLEEWRAQLQQLDATRRVDVVTAAAGPSRGEIEISVHRVLPLSSIAGARVEDGSEASRRMVPMVRLDDLAAELELRGPMLLKVDVEGAELEVLEGAQELLGACELVLLEVTFVELIEGAPQFGEVVEWMLAHGFVVADLYNGHNRPIDGALAQMDVAFLPRGSRFRAARGYATAAQNDALFTSWGY